MFCASSTSTCSSDRTVVVCVFGFFICRFLRCAYCNPIVYDVRFLDFFVAADSEAMQIAFFCIVHYVM